jgi:transposase
MEEWELEEQIRTHAEVVGDVGVLVAFLKQMDMPKILDGHIKRHHLDQGLSWGWVISIWLVYIVSQGDHRKVTVQDWVRDIHDTLELYTGLDIRDADFTDDRLTIALRHLSGDEHWNAIELDLGRNLIRIYDLPQETVRVDATTVSGYHQGGEGSLWQYGHSKDDPALRQIKIMMAALDPLGLPIALDIAMGKSADDPLYLPAIRRMLECLGKLGLLIVGDCKMSALCIRAAIDQSGQYYLAPLAQVGEMAKLLAAWVKEGLAKEGTLCKVIISDEDGTPRQIARGYEVTRTCTDGEHSWQERVLVAQSFAFADKQRKSLDERMQKAEVALLALTPPIGQGKRQITEQATLEKRAEAVLEKYGVKGLLTYTYERECHTYEKLVGRGRNGPNREREVVEQVRYQITGVQKQRAAIEEEKAMAGWRAYGTNAPQTRLPLEQAVLEYRNEYRVERVFGRFKGDRLVIAPMFVRRDDQVVGLPRLLSLGVRLLTLMEFVARRTLQQQHSTIAGLYLDSPRKTTDSPTAERLLRALIHIKLIIVYLRDRTVYQVEGFSHVHERILEIVGLPLDLYTSIARTVVHVTQAIPAV